ncbi:MAG TPA: penicillin-binding protein 2 [Solirubrobacteraceae bacterium]|nr:penicillin-binding protein 2 [Solirubrobacteraceae bacterium]
MKLIDRRVGWLFLAFSALLAVALLRALWLGTVQSAQLKQAAFNAHVLSETVPAQRGAITDATGVPLALSEPVDDVVADPYLVAQDHDARAMADALAPVLGMKVHAVLKALTAPGGYSPVAMKVAPSVAQRAMRLTVNGKPINGLSIEPDTKRVYPRPWELSQVLGYLNGSGSGVSGLEYLYNRQLAGQNGRREVIDNPSTGEPISIRTVQRVRQGRSIQLTVSSPLQSEVEQVLAGVGREWQPKFATAIVMQPQTGAILALGNWPRVNDNTPYAGAPAPVIDNAIEDHAVAFTYEPGSTFKAITVAGALQDHLITPSTNFTIPPSLQAYGKVVTDAEPHGYVDYTTSQILKVSSNIGADLIGRRLGPDRFNHWVHEFGLGRRTGVNLPGEADGYILNPSQYSGVSMLNLPFGQGEAVTPMQMANVYAAIANGGILRAPHIVKTIGGKSQTLPRGHRIVSTRTAAEIRDMLRGVLGDGGTASGAAIPGYDLAGKTGTANVAVDGRYSKSQYVASFIGMVPAADPKLVVAVVVDDPHGNIYGGSVAAPAFQKIVGWAVPYFGINPNPDHVRTGS